jgi:hypothetical protein
MIRNVRQKDHRLEGEAPYGIVAWDRTKQQTQLPPRLETLATTSEAQGDGRAPPVIVRRALHL